MVTLNTIPVTLADILVAILALMLIYFIIGRYATYYYDRRNDAKKQVDETLRGRDDLE